jgi:DNA helicase MCM9
VLCGGGGGVGVGVGNLSLHLDNKKRRHQHQKIFSHTMLEFCLGLSTSCLLFVCIGIFDKQYGKGGYYNLRSFLVLVFVCSSSIVSNPKGNYDVNNDVSVNTGIASPLLSRFDVILVLLDTNNPEWDQMVSTFILQSSLVSSDNTATSSGATANKSKTRPNLANSDQCWPVQILQAYVAFVKELKPELSKSSMAVLESYYLLQRKNDARSAARTTVRLLESLIRLSQAHARIMCRETVLLQDAIMAILVVEASLNINSMLDMESVLHTEFPADPEAEYLEMKDKVLSTLGLDENDLADAI